MAKDDKDLMVFENPDGSGRVILSKDPETGKYSVLTVGSIDVDEDSASDGTLHIKGDVTTDISIDGNVELYGNITGKIVASGDIHCNRTANLTKTAKISSYTNLDEYDITVINGNCEFCGDVGGFEDADSKTFITNHTLKIKNLAQITLHKSLSIVTNDRYGILHNGDGFSVPSGVHLSVHSSHEKGCGIMCDGTGENRFFWIDRGGSVEVYGKEFGVVTTGNDNYYKGTFHVDSGATANLYGTIAVCNSGDFYVSPEGKANIFGFWCGIKNCGGYASFILDNDSNVDCVGGDFGLIQDVYSISEPNKYGVRYNSSFHTRKGSTIKIVGDIGYMLNNDCIANISDNAIRELDNVIFKDAFISIEGNLYATSTTKADYSNIPIRCYQGGGKVYINNAIVWEGKDSEEYLKSERW